MTQEIKHQDTKHLVIGIAVSGLLVFGGIKAHHRLRGDNPLTAEKTSLATIIKQQAGIAASKKLKPSLIAAVMKVESKFDRSAVNKNSGATGLMQVMPPNFKLAGGFTIPKSHWADPHLNTFAGTTTLDYFLGIAHGNVFHGLQMYNAGFKCRNPHSRECPRSTFTYARRVLSEQPKFAWLDANA